MDDRLIRLGTRGSALARTQTGIVATLLREAHPEVALQIVEITTGGDRSQSTNATTPDWGSGVFVKELEAALEREEIDVAVHSLKDVPPVLPPTMTLVAVPMRDDPLDVLATADGRRLDDLTPGARVGTSSARRVAFLRRQRPDLDFEPIRGNVETRLRKMTDGQYDAVILARAGLRRLELDIPYVTLDPELLPPAPGQGALAIEARAGDRAIAELFEPLHDPATAAAVRAERRLMLDLDGGCRLPIGALGTPHSDGVLHLLGGVALDDASLAIATAVGRMNAPEELADELAGHLRSPGAGEKRLVLFG